MLILYGNLVDNLWSDKLLILLQMFKINIEPPSAVRRQLSLVTGSRVVYRFTHFTHFPSFFKSIIAALSCIRDCMLWQFARFYSDK